MQLPYKRQWHIENPRCQSHGHCIQYSPAELVLEISSKAILRCRSSSTLSWDKPQERKKVKISKENSLIWKYHESRSSLTPHVPSSILDILWSLYCCKCVSHKVKVPLTMSFLKHPSPIPIFFSPIRCHGTVVRMKSPFHFPPCCNFHFSVILSVTIYVYIKTYFVLLQFTLYASQIVHFFFFTN